MRINNEIVKDFTPQPAWLSFGRLSKCVYLVKWAIFSVSGSKLWMRFINSIVYNKEQQAQAYGRNHAELFIWVL